LSKGLVLGRKAAAKLYAVEGFSLSREAREMLVEQFNLLAKERRRLVNRPARLTAAMCAATPDLYGYRGPSPRPGSAVKACAPLIPHVVAISPEPLQGIE
jgi:hypothetical protein